MAAFGLPQFALLLFAWVAYACARSGVRSYRFKKFARNRGCQEPHDISGRGVKGMIDGFRRIRRVIDTRKNGKDVLDDLLAEAFSKSNTIQQTHFEGSVGLATIEPANIQAMLATQFTDFGVGTRRVNTFYPLLGNSIFSSDGSLWEHSRALFRPQFNREAINDLEETEKASKALIDAIGPGDSSGWTRGDELQPLLYNFTLDTATAFLFGESVNSQAAAKINGSLDNNIAAANKQFTADFELASRYMVYRIRASSMYWIMDGLALRQAVRRIRRFTERFVQIALTQSSKKAAETKHNLLSALASQTQDTTELRNQTLAILVAGRDTTAGLLGWSLTRLALHPKIFQKLRTHILDSFAPTEPITFTKIKNCRYLQHFLSEILRLHPNIPVNNREALRDTTLPVGGGPEGKRPVAVPKGQSVVFSVYLMHRRKDLWGPDALEFRPERWERRVPPWQWLAFGGGPRICIGQQFALTEASYVLIRMLQHFDGIEAVDREEMAKLRKGLGLTMWPGDNVRVRLHKASS